MKTTENPFQSAGKLPLSKLRYRAKLTSSMSNRGVIQDKALAKFMIRNTVAKYKDVADPYFDERKKNHAVGLFWRVDQGNLQLWDQLENKWGEVVWWGDYNDGVGKTICEAIDYRRVSFRDLILFIEGKHDGKRQQPY